MSYHIYTTPAIILESFAVGESSRLFRLFTKEFGILFARAQGVRELRSKQRYHLSDLSLVRIELIRGKEIWRITSAEAAVSFPRIMTNELKRKTIVAVLILLKKLFVGESAPNGIFDDMVEGMVFLEANDLSKDNLRDLEILFVAKILYHLGYWEAHSSDDHFFTGDVWREDTLAFIHPLRRELVARINQAINAAHL